MSRIRKFTLAGAAFAVAAMMAANVPPVSGQDGAAAGKKHFGRGARMHGGLAGAPLITIALKHKSELNLTGEQTANLEKIRNHYQSQSRRCTSNWRPSKRTSPRWRSSRRPT